MKLVNQEFKQLTLDEKDVESFYITNYKYRKFYTIRVYKRIFSFQTQKKLFQRLITLKNEIKLLSKHLPLFLLKNAIKEHSKEIKAIRAAINHKTNFFILVEYRRNGLTVTKDGPITSPTGFLPPYEKLKRLAKINAELKIKRTIRKEMAHSMSDYGTKYIQGTMIHTSPNQLRDIYLIKRTRDVFNEKLPRTDMKYLGVELEFCAPISKNEFALKMVEMGMHNYAQIKEDGSLRPREGETGFEVALLLPEKNYRLYLKKMCDLLASVKAVATDRRCGLHVHLDMRRRNKEIVYNNLVAAQQILWQIVDPSRQDGEFCATVHSKKFPIKFTGAREERYKSINAAAYYKYKTLEVRMHQGSVDYNEIHNWIQILLKITNYKKKLKNNLMSFAGFQKKFQLNDPTKNYVIETMNKWILTRPRPTQPTRRTHNIVSGIVDSVIERAVVTGTPILPDLSSIDSGASASQNMFTINYSDIVNEGAN